MRALPLACLLGVFALSTVSAASLQLSDVSSGPAPPAELSASLDFSVSGNTLTLTLSNQNHPIFGHYLTEVLFNAGPRVSGLSITPGEWVLRSSPSASPFGRFDFGLEPRRGLEPLSPGSGIAFVFTIAGAGPFSESDFTEALSAIENQGEQPVLAAAAFSGGLHGGGGVGGASAAGRSAACVVLQPAGDIDLQAAGGPCETPANPTGAGYDIIRGRTCELQFFNEAWMIDLGYVQCLASGVPLDRIEDLGPIQTGCGGAWFYLARSTGAAHGPYGAAYPDGQVERVLTGTDCP